MIDTGNYNFYDPTPEMVISVTDTRNGNFYD